MGKEYDIPVVTIHVEGGLVQSVDIPKGANVKVIVKDYDCEVDPCSKEAEGFNIKEDENGIYEEGIWEEE